jgi:aquaporin Z
MKLTQKMAAEFIGTFWLVLGGCGSAVLAAAFPDVGIGLLGVSLAFGLTVMTLIYGLGHISGAHFNPAVSVGLWMGGRFGAKELLPYILAQVLGGIAGAGILYIIATGKPGAEIGGFAANGFGTNSPGGYGLTAALVTEVVMTMMFLFIILGATDKRAPAGFAGIAIGLGINPHPPDQHPGDKYFSKSSQQHKPGIVCGRLGHRAIMAVLGGTNCWSYHSRTYLQELF